MAKDKIKLKSDSNEIWVTEFNQAEALEFREKVINISEENPTRPIVIRINSYGGEVDSLVMMIETLDEVPNPIITMCCGTAMSCGSVLLSHGDIRWVGKYSRIMVHEVSGGTGGNAHDVHTDAVELKRLNKLFMGLLAKNCGIKGGYEAIRKVIKSRDGREWYMTAEEALKFGIVDAIGTPRVEDVMTFNVGTTPSKDFDIKKKTNKRKPKR